MRDDGTFTFAILDETGKVMGRRGDRVSVVGYDTDETGYDDRCVVPDGRPGSELLGNVVLEVMAIVVVEA